MISIPKESTPDIEFGIIGVNTVYLWVGPTDIDQLITHKIEQAIKEIDGIKKISSTSRVGFSSIIVELENSANVNEVMVEIKDEVDKLQLPNEAEDPQVSEISTDSEAMFELILYGDRELVTPELLKQYARSIKDKLSSVDAISSIDIQGGDEFDIQVVLDKGKMEQMWISLSQITQTIRAFNQNIPLGNYTIGERNYDFRIQGELASPFDLLQLPIIGAVSELRLQDIAYIDYVYGDTSIRSFGSYQNNGYYSASLIFNKQKWRGVFSSSKNAKLAIEELLQTQEFANVEYGFTMDISEFIKEDYSILAKSGLQTLLFVFLCLVFFVGLKESSIATLAIPLSFMITFVVLNNTWSSLNFMTNFSLVLTLGIAIDTTIVIIEAASENMKLWFNPKTAVLMAVRDFHKPLIAGTTTTLVVFIPMMLLPGIIGKFLAYIPITVFVTLIAALFVSLTLNTALFYKLSKKLPYFHTRKSVEQFMSAPDLKLLEEERVGKTQIGDTQESLRIRLLERLNVWYEKVLRRFLTKRINRWLSVLLPVIVLIFTFGFNLGFSLFPQSDIWFFSMTVSSSPGTTRETMESYLPTIENILSDLPELKQYTTRISNNTISVNVDLLDKNERKREKMRDVFMVESDVLEKLTTLEQQWLKVASTVEGGGPPASKPVWLKLIAQDSGQFAQLIQVAREFETYLRGVDGLKNVSVSSESTPWQFVFQFDHGKLRSLWLTPADVATEVSAAINGVNAWSIKLQWDDRDIKLVYKEFTDTVSPASIESLVINTKVGPVVVGEILNYNIENAVGEVAREDTNILVRVDADLEEGYLGRGAEFQTAYEVWAESYKLPEWIRRSSAGEQQENAELIAATVQWFIISFFLIFGILVLQFNSYRKPAIIMYSVICALLWVNIWLWLTGNPYSMAFAIWFIALTGIVVNDAIILLYRIKENVAHEVDVFEAIIEAWRSRLQPIILTTLTTLLWVLPISLQDKFREGLGFTMIFWLFAGSMMTLFVIPSLYHIVFVKKEPKKEWK